MLYVLAGFALLCAAGAAAASAAILRKLTWLHDVLLPWVNAINDKLGLPK